MHLPVWFILRPVSEALYINTKRHQMTAPSCFYNQSQQDNILCLVCAADASLCSDHIIHKAVSRKKDRYECLYSPSHRLSQCKLSLRDTASCNFFLAACGHFCVFVLQEVCLIKVVFALKAWFPLPFMLIRMRMGYRTELISLLQKQLLKPCL